MLGMLGFCGRASLRQSPRGACGFPGCGLELVLMLAAWGVGCRPAEPTDAMRVEVRVADDTGATMVNVPVRVDGEVVGRTDGRGLARTQLVGRTGSRMQVAVDCPDTHRAAPPRLLTLRRGAAQAGLHRLATVCRPLQRTAVVVVRAPGAEGLPLFADGEPVGAVGPDGTAHLSVQRPVGAMLRVSLDTQGRPALRPRDPARQWKVEDRDALWVFDQTFTSEPVAPRRLRRKASGRSRRPPRSRPERLRSRR